MGSRSVIFPSRPGHEVQKRHIATILPYLRLVFGFLPERRKGEAGCDNDECNIAEQSHEETTFPSEGIFGGTNSAVHN
jgi:hypothetical protein